MSAVLRKVLTTSEGAALRRTLADAASLPLASFLTQWATLRLLLSAAWSSAAAAGSERKGRAADSPGRTPSIYGAVKAKRRDA